MNVAQHLHLDDISCLKSTFVSIKRGEMPNDLVDADTGWESNSLLHLLALEGSGALASDQGVSKDTDVDDQLVRDAHGDDSGKSLVCDLSRCFVLGHNQIVAQVGGDFLLLFNLNLRVCNSTQGLSNDEVR